jgi:hypothetical protein
MAIIIKEINLNYIYLYHYIISIYGWYQSTLKLVKIINFLLITFIINFK